MVDTTWDTTWPPRSATALALFRALAQVLVADGHFLAGQLDGVGRLPDLPDQGAQRFLHALQGLQEHGGLVMTLRVQDLAEVALRNPPGHRHGLLQRLAHRTQGEPQQG
jgi:hypothetical protein